MISFESVIVPLSAALGLSLVVERVLEFAKHWMQPFLRGSGLRKVPKLSGPARMVEELTELYERDVVAREVEEKAERKIKQRARLKSRLEKVSNGSKRKALVDQLTELEKDGEWDERFSNATILVEDATDPDDGLRAKFFILQLFGFAFGIVLARLSGVQLFGSLLAGVHTLEPWVDYLLTGLLIGGGSGPIHVLIRFVTQRKVITKAEASTAERREMIRTPSTPSAPAVVSTPSDLTVDVWVDIPYGGGVDRGKLEWVHKRSKNPDVIVYHHTAMSSKSTFEDVVRVIKSRTDSKGNHWLTGYNCVITSDGGIHPFCRWDRYGNHAAGYNRRSLGIAFNGNYETDPAVPFSNPDGRYGSPEPTDTQLRAGARVIALWTILYPIAVDFKNAIIPHNQISSKTCPGSVFPYEKFKKLVDFYRARWQKSSSIKERIEAFKLKPYLYV